MSGLVVFVPGMLVQAPVLSHEACFAATGRLTATWAASLQPRNRLRMARFSGIRPGLFAACAGSRILLKTEPRMVVMSLQS